MSLLLEPTNGCNLHCLHCMRDKLEERRNIPLDLVRDILRQARAYGLSYVGITGGEPTLHPHFADLLGLIAREGFGFHVITNGFQFSSRVLPLLLKPHIRKRLHHISISLDGASARTHDAVRGKGSFKVAMEMASLCTLKQIPFNLITVVNNLNRGELADIALLGSGLGATSHLFSPLCIAPLPLQKGIMPSPIETRKLISFVGRTLVKAFRMPIVLGTGGYCGSALLHCGVFTDYHLNVDYEGNVLFCCTLSHPAGNGVPNVSGEELLADLKRESLATAIVRQQTLIAGVTEERLKAAEAGALTELDHFPCYWCLKRFGKLEWLRDYPDSPWAEPSAAAASPRTHTPLLQEAESWIRG